MLTIIEDCSPYYVRFTHESVPAILAICRDNDLETEAPFTHQRLPTPQALTLLQHVPKSRELDLSFTRASLFITNPGHKSMAHKDGFQNRFSLNYTVDIRDDLCETCWYCDRDLSGYTVHQIKEPSRDLLNFDKSRHTPLKSMVAKQGEAILFNTDIYHDWDNSKSPNRRVVLTLHAKVPGAVYFSDAHKILFDNRTS